MIDKLRVTVCVVVAFLIIAFIVKSDTLTVTCEAGGPYTRAATKIVKGEVTNGSENVIANVTVNITSTGYSAQVISNRQGRYSVKFKNTMDIGAYTVNVIADNNTNSGSCIDTFEVKSTSTTADCLDKNITVAGRAMFAASGALIPEGNVTATIVGDKGVTNSTRVSNGYFSVNLAGCLKPADRFLIKIHVVKDAEENWSYVIITAT
jgi:hypothetical protein